MKLEGTGQETNICRNLLCTRHHLGTLCTLAYQLLRNQLENVGEGPRPDSPKPSDFGQIPSRSGVCMKPDTPSAQI